MNMVESYDAVKLMIMMMIITKSIINRMFLSQYIDTSDCFTLLL